MNRNEKPDSTGRRRGRPQLPEKTIAVGTRLPASEADRLMAFARAHRISVSRLVRQVLIIVLPPLQ